MSAGTECCPFLLYQKSKQKGKRATSLIDIAREWGTKILSPEDLMAELKRMKLHPVPEGHEKSEKHYKGEVCPSETGEIEFKKLDTKLK